ncbi:MAG: hypothetical protein E7307_02060 [Butyrivibrio sp.]|nr:hypothetical protein [Butyrivibrio sp.]
MRMKNEFKKLKKKLSKRGGFTLVELLFSILILMLSTTIIIQCFNLGLGNVVKETRSSEAQLLCSALTSSLQNELTYARDITITDGKLDTYFSSSRRMGVGSKIIFQDGDATVTNGGEIKIQSVISQGGVTTTTVYPLVASSNYTAANRAGVSNSGYFLKAYLDGGAIQWDNTNQVFIITLWVDDGSKPALSATDAQTKALAYSQFRVKPLAGVKPVTPAVTPP